MSSITIPSVLPPQFVPIQVPETNVADITSIVENGYTTLKSRNFGSIISLIINCMEYVEKFKNLSGENKKNIVKQIFFRINNDYHLLPDNTDIDLIIEGIMYTVTNLPKINIKPILSKIKKGIKKLFTLKCFSPDPVIDTVQAKPVKLNNNH